MYSPMGNPAPVPRTDILCFELLLSETEIGPTPCGFGRTVTKPVSGQARSFFVCVSVFERVRASHVLQNIKHHKTITHAIIIYVYIDMLL